MSRQFGIIDLFAGPGGLGEGFSAAGRETGTSMKIRLSIEKEATEVRTLRLRSFLRSFEDGFPPPYYTALNNGSGLPDWSTLYPVAWARAENEVRQLELGRPGVFEEIAAVLDRTREGHHGDTILIGGPPCQAYSLAGRSRNAGKAGYVPEEDKRHFLYREYVAILNRLRPAAFVMENVKGMISSKVGGGDIFQRVLEDLRNAGDGYTLVPLAASRESADIRARDFIVRADEHGVPQARHRVFVVGIRNDLAPPAGAAPLLKIAGEAERTDVWSVIAAMPRLRSGLSRGGDDHESWQVIIHEHADRVIASTEVAADIRAAMRRLKGEGLATATQRSATRYVGPGAIQQAALDRWLLDPFLERILDHETRAHIPGDLGRYLYAALFAQERGKSPKLADFPSFLMPEHRNRDSGKFADRFRVQVGGRPSSTVTSHISKDGHYFIHPDPSQARSLTVREAARLQTFPDNYFFCGNRTQQYHQVGNAVPPFLALKIARVIREIIGGSS
ncbi:DNA cytosine methyltransferase [Rhodovulum sulfidophilum]|uniref:DNA cytosine methyltransferase n=1 Tax=Rhodovulum sulfidophilum TaxID=35806 RepID=UPI001928601D|nr:DNA cytosine methyltransferase [Rhodovulum sulfidophilum]MBL3586515.1 DNA cytosine methyltransferase [Rhodovulum sulfidophilum]